jgi:hypothetical protein
MEIAFRANEPWDALFVFHFFSSSTHQDLEEKLQRLVSREYRVGLSFDAPIAAGKKGSDTQILGRFLERKQCANLLSRWNEPEGEIDWICYSPNYGIATVNDGQLDWWALICFQCANAGVGGPHALQESAVPNRTLPEGPAFQNLLLDLLPERDFPIRS